MGGLMQTEFWQVLKLACVLGTKKKSQLRCDVILHRYSESPRKLVKFIRGCGQGPSLEVNPFIPLARGPQRIKDKPRTRKETSTCIHPPSCCLLPIKNFLGHTFPPPRCPIQVHRACTLTVD